MAGAFDDFTPPPQQPSGGAFSDFKPPTAAQPSTPTDPESIMLQHMASWLPGAAYLHNLTKVGEYGLTGGLSNRWDQAFSGNTIEQEAAKQRAAQQAVGPIPSFLAQTAGNMAGIGKLTGGMGPIAAGALQGATQGVGESNDPSQIATSGAIGGAFGGALSLAGSVVNPAIRAVANKTGIGIKTPEAITNALQNQEKQDWQATRGIRIPNADVRQAAVQAQQDIENQAVDNPRVLIGGQNAYQKLTDLGNEALRNEPVTAERLNDYVRGLNVKNTGDMSPQAGLLAQNRINQLLSGQGQDAIDTAQATSKAYRAAQDLQMMGQKLEDFGTSPAAKAQSIATRFYDRGTPAYDALKDIANSGNSYQSAWGLSHAAHAPISAVLGGLGVTGHFGEMAGLGATYMLAKPAINKAIISLQQGAKQQAIQNAYPALTGMQTSWNPNVAADPAVRALLFGPLLGATSNQ